MKINEVNRENCNNFIAFQHVSLREKDQSHVIARKVENSKNDSFRVPVIVGKQYFYIDENNANEWNGITY